MIKFFSRNKKIFYVANFTLIFIYIYPGSIIGQVIYGSKKIQPQITSDFVISSNHFYVFILLSIIGFLTFVKIKEIKILIWSLPVTVHEANFANPIKYGNLYQPIDKLQSLACLNFNTTMIILLFKGF